MTYFSEIKPECKRKLIDWFEDNIGCEYEIYIDDDYILFTWFELYVEELQMLRDFLTANDMYAKVD